jgi:hypothetical protein
MTLPRKPEVERALTQASTEVGLAEYYRDCVRPILGTPRAVWPRCCGGGCEPCAETLNAVARRTHELLGTPDLNDDTTGLSIIG